MYRSALKVEAKRTSVLYVRMFSAMCLLLMIELEVDEFIVWRLLGGGVGPCGGTTGHFRNWNGGRILNLERWFIDKD